MSKTETVRQLAAAKNEQRIEHLASQMQALRSAEIQKTEELAALLEPLAQAMAALTDETRQTLAEIERKTKEQAETFNQRLELQAKHLHKAAEQANSAASSLRSAAYNLNWTHYVIVIITGIISAVIVSGFWLWLAPPTIQNSLDAESVAKFLKPAVTAALKHSRSR